jgi:3-oxoadipate enol-lactonase
VTEVRDIQLYYEEKGPPNAFPLVFIHGFPFNHTIWTPQWESLPISRRAVRYDLRGHGQSEPGDGQYTLELFVDDLMGLLDHLEISRAILCGLSMGGYIALRTQEKHPERILGLVLCDTKSEADANEDKLKRAENLKLIKTKGVAPFAEAFVKTLFAAGTYEKKPDLVRSVGAMIEGNPPLGICGTLLALAGRTDTTESLSKIHIPTLIFVGEEDKITPPAASQSLHEKIPGSTLAVISQAGHLSNLENPEEFNRHLSDFLERIR